MPCCRVCGEEKPAPEFYSVPNFTKYKKHKVLWCRSCQKLWMDMKKMQEYSEKYLYGEPKFTVSFE
jgi:hypothetical protein